MLTKKKKKICEFQLNFQLNFIRESSCPVLTKRSIGSPRQLEGFAVLCNGTSDRVDVV